MANVGIKSKSAEVNMPLSEREKEAKMFGLNSTVSRLEREVEELKLKNQMMVSQLSQQTLLLDKIIIALRKKGIDIDEITE